MAKRLAKTDIADIPTEEEVKTAEAKGAKDLKAKELIDVFYPQFEEASEEEFDEAISDGQTLFQEMFDRDPWASRFIVYPGNVDTILSRNVGNRAKNVKLIKEYTQDFLTNDVDEEGNPILGSNLIARLLSGVLYMDNEGHQQNMQKLCTSLKYAIHLYLENQEHVLAKKAGVDDWRTTKGLYYDPNVQFDPKESQFWFDAVLVDGFSAKASDKIDVVEKRTGKDVTFRQRLWDESQLPSVSRSGTAIPENKLRIAHEEQLNQLSKCYDMVASWAYKRHHTEKAKLPRDKASYGKFGANRLRAAMHEFPDLQNSVKYIWDKTYDRTNRDKFAAHTKSAWGIEYLMFAHYLISVHDGTYDKDEKIWTAKPSSKLAANSFIEQLVFSSEPDPMFRQWRKALPAKPVTGNLPDQLRNKVFNSIAKLWRHYKGWDEELDFAGMNSLKAPEILAVFSKTGKLGEFDRKPQDKATAPNPEIPKAAEKKGAKPTLNKRK